MSSSTNDGDPPSKVIRLIAHISLLRGIHLAVWTTDVAPEPEMKEKKCKITCPRKCGLYELL